jgi:hypothetical protein
MSQFRLLTLYSTNICILNFLIAVYELMFYELLNQKGIIITNVKYPQLKITHNVTQKHIMLFITLSES